MKPETEVASNCYVQAGGAKAQVATPCGILINPEGERKIQTELGLAATY